MNTKWKRLENNKSNELIIKKTMHTDETPCTHCLFMIYKTRSLHHLITYPERMGHLVPISSQHFKSSDLRG